MTAKKKTPAQESFEKVAHIGNNLPDMDDKSQVSLYLNNLSSTNPMIKSVAAEYTGRIAEKYGAEFVILCGALNQLKNCLLDDNPSVVYRAAIAIGDIARSGGSDKLLEEDITDILMGIIKSPNHKLLEKNAAAQAIGWIYAAKMTCDAD
jgi:HEAT repeat protein